MNADFVEWMNGLPAGWVTDVADVEWKDQIHLLGNGVVPQQALLAYRAMLPALFGSEKAA